MEMLLRGVLQRQEQLVLNHPRNAEYRETLGSLKDYMAHCEEAAGHYPGLINSSNRCKF